MELAKQALQLFLTSLPLGSHFNIMPFDSSYFKFFPQSVTYDDSTFNNARSRISSIKADGGTEVLGALQDIYSQNMTLPRQIYILTDGAISNLEQVLALIRQNQHKGKVHMFGIGTGVNRDFVIKSAKTGNGHYYFITNLSEITEKVQESLQSDFVDYLQVEETSFLDSNDQVVKQLPHINEIRHQMKYSILDIFPTEIAKKFRIIFYNPNINARVTEIVDLTKFDDFDAPEKLAVAVEVQKCQDQGKRIELSKKYSVVELTAQTTSTQMRLDSTGVISYDKQPERIEP